MALPSFLKRKDSAAKPLQPSVDGADAQQARMRARRRLIGAAVLLLIGVVTFPLLFETQPRPIPLDIPIESAPRQAPPVSAPVEPKPAKPAKERLPPVEPSVQLAADEPPAAASAAASTPVVASVQASAPTPPARPAAPTTAAKEAALPPATGPSTPAVEPKTGRFVVQVGAFADATAARAARLKVERLGLKTYTQVIDTDGGKRTRVRVGPFESREEASKVLARIKAVDLPGAVLAL